MRKSAYSLISPNESNSSCGTEKKGLDVNIGLELFKNIFASKIRQSSVTTKSYTNLNETQNNTKCPIVRTHRSKKNSDKIKPFFPFKHVIDCNDIDKTAKKLTNGNFKVDAQKRNSTQPENAF
mmetsp:Transcript_12994/g.14947  ORF Transcript_12994/g.14947 Transcript_12994/m.14947 type:complete len:123 (+) Transcript_12994:176-544(+)